jgi:hypothetical protein
MRENDRATLLALAADVDFKTAFVDDNLRPLQSILRSSKYGALQGVDILPLADEGKGKIGLSVWKFEQHVSCYETELTPAGGSWKVMGWGAKLHCPPDVKK